MADYLTSPIDFNDPGMVDGFDEAWREVAEDDRSIFAELEARLNRSGA